VTGLACRRTGGAVPAVCREEAYREPLKLKDGDAFLLIFSWRSQLSLEVLGEDGAQEGSGRWLHGADWEVQRGDGGGWVGLRSS